MTLSLELKNLDKIEQQINKTLSFEINKRTKRNTGRVIRELKALVRGWIEQSPEMMSLEAQGVPGSLNAAFGLPPGMPGMAVAAISSAVAESLEISIQKVNNKLEGNITFNFVNSSFATLLGLPQGFQQTEYGTDLHWLGWLLTKGDAIIVQGFEYEPSNGGRSGGGSMKIGGYFKVPSTFSGTPVDNFITRAFQGKEKQISAVLNKFLV